jgi:sec-independent protein translocase protein TatC
MTSVLVSFALSGHIASFLMAPVSNLGVSLHSFSPAEKFMAYLHIAAAAGVVFSSPFLILQAGMFIWPALIGRERRYAVISLLVVPLLFLSGSAAAYIFLAPSALRFFLSFGSGDGVEAMWGFRQYISLLSGLMLASGLLLQMPLITLVLFALGIASPRKAASMRPYIVLLIFFLAGVLTPPDITSQLMLGIPLYLLFEATILLGMLMTKRRK